jgi:autotransporter-associated beta strand protein
MNMTKRQRSIFAISLLAGSASLWTALASAQDFQSQGPAPAFGPATILGTADQPPNGTTSGAIQAIAISPLNSSTMFVGATNGGIWVTRNGGSSWQPLTEKKLSLSISSLAYDPTDANRMIAGVGATSNGRVGSARGGQLTGIMYSSNGGTDWTDLAGSGGALRDKNIISVAARGSNLLAAATNMDEHQGGGLYYSPNGGGTFALVQGLAAGSVGALAADNSSDNANGKGTRFYAAVSGTNVADNGVYLGDPTKPATWSKMLPLGANRVAKLATGPGGSVVAAVYDSSTGLASSGKLVAIYLSQNSGKDWTSMTSNLPNTNPGSQAEKNLAVAIDPSNPNIVYIAGDRNADSPIHSLAAFRLTLTGNTFSVASLTDEGTANDSSVHADARTLVFDASGRMIFGGDGGIYVRTSPASSAGAWSGLNTSGLSVREIYGIAYDAVSKRMIVAAQDNGTAFQGNRNSADYNGVGTTGDGVNAVVNDRSSPTQSIIYLSAQNLRPLTRMTVNTQGITTSTRFFNSLNVAADDKSDVGEGSAELPFFSRIVVNRKDPNRLAIATNYVYTTTDDKLVNSNKPLTSLGKIVPTINTSSAPTALAYGTQDDADALLAGSTVTTGSNPNTVTTNSLYLAKNGTPLTRLAGYGGEAPTSVVFDDRTAARYYVADGAKLWKNDNATTATSFTDLTTNLGQLNLERPTAVEFISKNGVNALLVGALSNVAGSKTPIAVADSTTSGDLSNWRPFGNGIPNTLISQLSYNPLVDVLAVGTFGRGAWLLYDVTTFFATATKLVYGAADNDSNPDAVWLTGGRPLEKVGTGTLTIAGNATYTGSTTVSNGTLVANGSLASSSDLTIRAAGLVRGTGTLPSTSVFGAIWPGTNNTMGTLSVSGNLGFNPGSAFVVDVAPSGQSGKITAAGATTIAGGTVSLVVAPGTFAPRTRYTLLSSSGGVSGSFSSLDGSQLPWAFLRPSLLYDDQNVFLNLQIGGFAAVAQTPTQYAVGAALDASAPFASGDYATAVTALAQLDPSQVPAILTSLSGQNYSGFSSSMVQGARLFMNNFLSQAGSAHRGQGRIALAEACDVACDTTEPAKWGAWGGALGGLGTVGAGQSAGVTYNVGGFAGGLDRKITNNFLAGMTVGYTSGSQWVGGFSGQGFSNTFQTGLYAGYAEGPAYLDGIVGYAYSGNQLSRSIVIPGLAPRIAVGQAGANQFYGQVEGGWRFGLGGPIESFVTPFARLQAYTGTQNAFTESGAQSLSLNVAAQTTNSLRTVLGAQLGGAVDMGWREKLNAQLRLGWSHEYGDTSRPVSASFVGAPTVPFTTFGGSPQRDGVVIGLAANTAIAEATSIYLRYEGDISGQDTSHALTAGVRMTW